MHILVICVYLYIILISFIEKKDSKCLNDHNYSTGRNIPVSKNIPGKKRLQFGDNKENMLGVAKSKITNSEHAKVEPKKNTKVKNIEPILNVLKFEHARSDVHLLGQKIRTEMSHATTVQQLVNVCMKNEEIRRCFERSLAEDIRKSTGRMSALKHGSHISVLSKISYEDLTTFSWQEVLEEFSEKHTSLARILVAACMPGSDNTLDSYSQKAFVEASPMIGMMYSMIMQSRVHYLSRVQRVIAHCLQESTCERKVLNIFCHFICK